MKKIYISGPYTKGDVVQNIQRVIAVAEILTSRGYLVFVPHLTHLWHMISPHPYEFWMKYDIQWLMECDAMYRLPGESAGADQEERLFRMANLPVYTDLAELTDLTGKAIEVQEC